LWGGRRRDDGWEKGLVGCRGESTGLGVKGGEVELGRRERTNEIPAGEGNTSSIKEGDFHNWQRGLTREGRGQV